MQTQTRPVIMPMSANASVNASRTLHDFALAEERLAQLKAEIDAVEADHARLHAQARQVLADNGNPRVTGVWGDFYILRDEHGISAIRQGDVASSADFGVGEF